MSQTSGRKGLLIKLLLSVLIAVALLWYTVDHMVQDAAGAIPDGRVGAALWDAVRGLPWWGIVGYVALFLVVHVSRIVRWVVQVRPLGETDFKKVFRICAVGFGAIIVMPLRLGEVVRPYMLAQESDVTFAEALGTAVVERIVDGLVITGLLFLAVWTAPEPVPVLVRSTGLVSLFVFVGASVGLSLFAWRRDATVWLLRQTVGRVSEGISTKIEGLFSGFIDGVAALASGGILVPFAALTVLYWGANAAGMWLLAQAFGLPLGFFAGFGLLAMLVVGIMIPAGPGFFGNFQLFLGEALKLYLPAASIGAVGLAFSLSMNAIQFVIQVGFSIPFFIASGLRLGELVEVTSDDHAADQSTQT